jgi:ABC-type amino acid transport substrate-binding protein
MVVGTAPNYPPFRFYDDNFQLDGFDIALMSEVLGRWRFRRVQDYAFDGLDGA